MAVTLTGSAVGLFPRLGVIFGYAKKVRTHAVAAIPTSLATTTGIRTLYSEFNGGSGTYPKAASLISPIASEDAMAAPYSTIWRMCRDAARKTLIEMVDADTKLPTKVGQEGVNEAIRELAKQMVSSSDSVNATTYTVGAASYASGNVGTFTVFVSAEATKIIRNRVTFATKITDMPCIRPETLYFTCAKDSRRDGLRSGSEVFNVVGDRSYDNMDRRWRAGSGTNMNVTMTSADIDQSQVPGQNVLNNSDFELISSNVPVQWTLDTGTPGTHLTSTATAYRGSSAISIVGDGSNLTKLRQITNSTSGTNARIKPDTLYLIAFAIRHDGTPPAAGVLRVSLQDGSANLLAGMAKSVTLSGITSSYVVYSAMVNSPIDIPASTYAVVELTTALTNTRAVYVDELVIAEMPRPAKGGPGICVYPGATDARYGDSATVAISYNNTGEFNLELDRFFNLYENGLALPSNDSGTETIVDSLIVDP